MRSVVIFPQAGLTLETEPLGLDRLKAIVGWYLEEILTVHTEHGRLSVIDNEDGNRLNLPPCV